MRCDDNYMLRHTVVSNYLNDRDFHQSHTGTVSQINNRFGQKSNQSRLTSGNRMFIFRMEADLEGIWRQKHTVRLTDGIIFQRTSQMYGNFTRLEPSGK